AVSSSGFQLIEPGALDAIKDLLLPLATVVTPNRREAATLAGVETDEHNMDGHSGEESNDLTSIGARLLQTGARAVLITDGETSATDVLFEPSGSTVYRGEFVESTNTHGTGCTLSSALACLLARSIPLKDAVREAKGYVEQAIRSGPNV